MSKYRIIDSHCHIYPDGIAHKAIASIDRFYDGLPTACQYDGTPGTLLKTGAADCVVHFVVHSVATVPHQVQSINRFIAGAVAGSGGRFTGLGAMHPDSPDMEADLDHLTGLGLRGVKVHPDFQKFHADDDKAMRMFALLEKKGIPVLVHTGDFRYDYSNPGRVAHVLEAFPKLKFIAAHLGGWSVWDDALRILPAYPNIMVDTSSSMFYMKPEKAREIIRAFGADRVLFGTDYPMWTLPSELDYMRALALTEEEYDRIFRRNCAGLYGIDLESPMGD